MSIWKCPRLRNYFILFLLLLMPCCLFIILVIYKGPPLKMSNSTNGEDDIILVTAPVRHRKDNHGSNYRWKDVSNCIVNHKGQLFELLDSIITACVKQFLNVRSTDFLQLDMGRFHEKKFFLPFTEESLVEKPDCRFLTIGIGGTSYAEAQFSHIYPKCKIYGIEPSTDQYANFRRYGTVIPHAVGATDEVATLSFLKNGTYVIVKSKVHAIHKVLDKYVGSRFIHFTTMDIEGFEYRILDQMEEGRYIHNQSVTFCQLDVELHDNVMQKLNSLKNFNQYFRSFLMHSSYVPIVSTRFLTHQKVTLINSQNQECEALFNFEQLLKPFAEKTYLIVKAIERNSTISLRS
ncbi:Uncharacterized protein C28H8.8 [Toxocara canis]|uniref:Uncharacterized protein C28H8.8 n=1 Tax=Toxocara canis TaxID=6265 RepID=A0A0B2V5E4_TOXCA|nr:Uncharacterized protein C28H8.8 [Toxocara canis]